MLYKERYMAKELISGSGSIFLRLMNWRGRDGEIEMRGAG